MLTTATKNKINTARDILVGKIPMPTSQVEQITLALVYKFMSDMDKKARDLGDTSGFFANGYEKYSWDKLMDKFYRDGSESPDGITPAPKARAFASYPSRTS